MPLIPASHSPWREKLFLPYIERRLQSTFHRVYLDGNIEEFNDDGNTPLIVVMNHSSWWDVLLAYWIEYKVFGWERYGVMEAGQLERYRFFAKLGMIGVDRSSLAHVREFMEYVTNLLRGQRRSLWITPQGEMLSNYQRPIRFQSGLAHLAADLERFYFCMVVTHSEFWIEPRPEAFFAVSPVTLVETKPEFDRKAWSSDQALRMETMLDSLLLKVQNRDASAFSTVLEGKTGINGIYDTLRAMRAKASGKSFNVEHGAFATPTWKARKNQ